jgi:hypothetical protein
VVDLHLVLQDRDLDRRDLARAVGIVRERAGRLVVDEAVLRIAGLLAGEEGVLRKLAVLARGLEKRIVDADGVVGVREVGDRVDVRRLVRRRVEDEGVRELGENL